MREIRNKNLRKLIQDKFNGSRPDFEAATGFKLAQISQWLAQKESEHSRNMSEQSARRIESKCLLPRGWLDIDHSKNSIKTNNWPFTNITEIQYQAISNETRQEIEDFILFKMNQSFRH